MNEQVKAALLRAVAGALIVAGVQFFQAIANPELDWRYVVSLTGGAFFSVLMTRGVAEGLIDAWRNATGRVSDADVGATPATPAIGAAVTSDLPPINLSNLPPGAR